MSINRCIGKSVTVLLSLFVVLALSTSVLQAQTGEQEAYQAARQQNTIEAWESYLKKYPTGENAKAARESHDALLLQDAGFIVERRRSRFGRIPPGCLQAPRGASQERRMR